jgi:hypothetical protein
VEFDPRHFVALDSKKLQAQSQRRGHPKGVDTEGSVNDEIDEKKGSASCYWAFKNFLSFYLESVRYR